jgi:hypothetical protein
VIATNEVLASLVQQQVASFLAGKPAPVPVAIPSRPTKLEPVAFVCEDDVKCAVRDGKTIAVGERTIITPAARDLANAHRVFVTV